MSYSKTDYYAEGLAEAFDEHGVTATPEQIRAIAGDVVGWAESIGMAFHVPAGDPRDSELADLRKQLERERNKVACWGLQRIWPYSLSRPVPRLYVHLSQMQWRRQACPMTSRQRARRLLIWRGSFCALTLLSLLMLASALADRVTS
ncbi:hypothetical protein [Pseudomonas saponiphila]|uniref:hypothetical protein n=1 Tax=Pseudomonas saponiphila TaxID=556534 RepID=UPI000B897DAB|nr:hypothetical protein [Pseudomonas saponiphila]